MFIVWGKKRVTTWLGYVADFCPICRDLRTFEVTRIGLAGHVYYISFGEGELAGHIRTCTACDIDLNARPENYRELHKEKLAPQQLAPLTFPNWAQAHATRLAVEREISSAFGNLAPQVRQVLIREPFELLSPRVEERFRASHFDGPTALAILGLFVLLWIASEIAQRFPAVFLVAFGVASIVGLGGIGVALYQKNGRFFREKIIPPLVAALRPLKPTAAELETVLKEMKSHRHAIGKKLKLKWLLDALKTDEAGAVGS
ncbi:MAG: hypothetical protein HY017_16770 [Betaproteobacteria bacterium]|nr:hypothetical protein [Betaproteobacteria bacterium]